MACDDSCEVHRFELEPNPDVGGIGVLVGFLGTAWLVVILVVIRYVLAFNPPLDMLIGLYVTGKLFFDLFASELSDLYWLVVSATWATQRLLTARGSADVHDMQPQNEWGFGQVLPVFLLLGPIATVVFTMRSEDQDEEERSHNTTQFDGVVGLYQTDIQFPQQGNDTQRLGQWLLDVVLRCNDEAEAFRHLAAIVQVNAERNRFAAFDTLI
ncbi:hypothetical protein Cob_v011350 [Colletotrichum orbiculare MAFF 240422]|uniref:Uncharacterized protein n=1 Tax=Colletotrichum orbiculare (strain 104-T / ATCC 96160 / CBS 514.97 / LARS 414 / MAFF 240422) TaxID=1213857 RepID=A0A484FDH4_COLOR|nr:hypothetical protein Cob_v011350 [Colletotrichum orbiculare MAFF 240422]